MSDIGWVLLERARIEAAMTMLVDSGDMTPQAVRILNSLMNEAQGAP